MILPRSHLHIRKMVRNLNEIYPKPMSRVGASDSVDVGAITGPSALSLIHNLGPPSMDIGVISKVGAFRYDSKHDTSHGN